VVWLGTEGSWGSGVNARNQQTGRFGRRAYPIDGGAPGVWRARPPLPDAGLTHPLPCRRHRDQVRRGWWPADCLGLGSSRRTTVLACPPPSRQ